MPNIVRLCMQSMSDDGMTWPTSFNRVDGIRHPTLSDLESCLSAMMAYNARRRPSV